MGSPKKGFQTVGHKEPLERQIIRQFYRFWELATDALAPQDTKSLEEDLGIEVDTPEHVCLEQGPLCSSSLKRKRV